MRAAVLGGLGSAGEQPCPADPIHSVRGLSGERRRLDAPRLFRHCRISQELRQTAGGAQPHLQWVQGVRTRILGSREIVASWLPAEVHDQMACLLMAGSADGPGHDDLLLADGISMVRLTGLRQAHRRHRAALPKILSLRRQPRRSAWASALCDQPGGH